VSDEATIADESVDLLSQLIRNQCVNDGDDDSGFESRSADTLAQFLGTSGLDIERYTARPGRESVVARIEGSDPTAPTLLLMGHTDVVPANEDGWQHDPFGAELIDGEVWGRGAVDMLNLTATMAVAFRNLARTGYTPRGTLVYLGVADEENLGAWGADHLLQHEHDAVMADYVVTEAGGFQIPSAAGPRLPVIVGEKGSYWCRISVRGTPGHASQPFRTDNALITAAEVVRRLAEYQPPTMIHDTSGWVRHAIDGRRPLGVRATVAPLQRKASSTSAPPSRAPRVAVVAKPATTSAATASAPVVARRASGASARPRSTSTANPTARGTVTGEKKRPLHSTPPPPG